MRHLSDEQRAIVESWGEGAVADLAERAAIMAEAMPEREAWRLAFERERQRRARE